MSSSRDDFRDDQDGLHRRASAEMSSLALGENVPLDLVAHVALCAECQVEVDELRHVVGFAKRGLRPGDDVEAVEPPPAVWDGIVAALAPAAPPRRRPVRAVMLGAAAVVLIAVAAVTGWLIGRGDTSTPATAARATLTARDGTSGSAHGSATVQQAPDGFRMSLQTSGLPARTGYYYEVWLYDPVAAHMIAVGVLGADASGTFTMPAGLDMTAYRVVDVSAQRVGGAAAHQRSVLRGSLVR